VNNLHCETTRIRTRLSGQGESGQAFIEFTFVALAMIVMLFALIDFGRVIYERQVMVNLTREGSNLASRGTSLTNTLTAITNSAAPLNISTKGRVILTAVYNNNGSLVVSNQLSAGGIFASSKVGTTGGPATLPATAFTIPQSNQYLYVTEVFYSYAPITPIGKLLSITLPTQLYDAAYF